MQVAREFKPGSIYIGRLRKGADIIRSIETFCAEKNIRAAWVNIIGALDRATLSYYDQKTHQYFHRSFVGEYEITSCSGNISIRDGKPFAHLHITLSDTDFNAFGGHLWPDSASVFAAEYVIFELDKEPEDADLERCPDADTGLALWK
ncbi:MAG TPA: PPC domain-containing DNA-binding protein [Oculatellaceae cyanobacterium]|jgi:predicted DNA-binding protein with PD1-like motif